MLRPPTRLAIGRVIIAAAISVLAACAGDDPVATPGPSAATDGRAVSFDADDGTTLTGTLRGSGTVGVVLSHMFPADDGAASWAATAERLADDGYLTLAFNFRGYVDSGGDRDIGEIHADVEAAHLFLLSQGAEQVAYLGASMGGTASLVTAARLEPVAIVTVSAPAQFRGLDAEVVARELMMPVLLLSASGDDVAATSLETLADLIPRAEAKLFAGDAHGTNLLTESTSVEDDIAAFLQMNAPAKAR